MHHEHHRFCIDFSVFRIDTRLMTKASSKTNGIDAHQKPEMHSLLCVFCTFFLLSRWCGRRCRLLLSLAAFTTAVCSAIRTIIMIAMMMITMIMVMMMMMMPFACVPKRKLRFECLSIQTSCCASRFSIDLRVLSPIRMLLATSHTHTHDARKCVTIRWCCSVGSSILVFLTN